MGLFRRQPPLDPDRDRPRSRPDNVPIEEQPLRESSIHAHDVDAHSDGQAAESRSSAYPIEVDVQPCEGSVVGDANGRRAHEENLRNTPPETSSGEGNCSVGTSSLTTNSEMPRLADVNAALFCPPDDQLWVTPTNAPMVTRIDSGPMSGEVEVGAAGKLSQVRRSIPPKPSGSYIPSNVVDVASAGDLTVGAVSVRGLGHQDFPTVRQDAVAFGITRDGGYVIGVIADGVSEASDAHIGADAATKTALNVVRSALEAGGTPTSIDWRAVSEATRQAVRSRAEVGLKAGALGSGGAAGIADEAFVRVVGTTAEVLVVETRPMAEQQFHFTRVVVAGDGYGYILGPRGWVGLGTAKASSNGVLSNAVSAPLPRDPGVPVVQHGSITPGQAVLITTDGIGDDVLSGRTAVAGFLLQLVRPMPPHKLLELVSYVAFQSDDDRTVFIAWA